MRTVFSEEHHLFRDQFRKFLEKEVLPHHAQWEREGVAPKEVWRKAGANGFLNVKLPEPYGGGGDFGHSAVLIEELARVNATALGFALHSDVVAPYIYKYGNTAQKDQWLTAMASGDAVGAIAMTEPSTGSDLKAIRTTAIKDGDHYVINGQKTFITNGINCDVVIVVCKTAPELGSKGISLLLVDSNTPGFGKGRKLEKIGLHGQDTSELFFENCRVHESQLLGEENKGFGYLMQELAQERLVIAIRAAASAESFLEKTVEYAKDRNTFGKNLFEFQNTKFKLAEIKAYATMLRAFVDECMREHLQGQLTLEKAAMCKLTATNLQGKLLDDMLQIHGGYGFMSEYVVGQAWVDARVGRIYGGSDEIMKEIISRAL